MTKIKLIADNTAKADEGPQLEISFRADAAIAFRKVGDTMEIATVMDWTICIKTTDPEKKS